MAKYPYLAILPAALDASFAQFTPAAMKSLRHAWGGVPNCDSDSKGEYQNLMETWRGVCVFYGRFSPEVPTLPPNKKF